MSQKGEEMKTLIVGLILLLAVPAMAVELSQKEYDDLMLLSAEKTNLIAIAKTVDLEKVPLQIAQKKEERVALLVARDAELKTEDQKNAAAKQVIMDTYQALINTKDGEIASLNASINP